MITPDPNYHMLGRPLDPELGWQSRCHPLAGYLPASGTAPVYVKREDELSANVSGSKHRKYLSLLPDLEHSGIRHVILTGSAHSNNVLDLARLLKQRGYGISALLKAPGNGFLRGNFLLLNMLLEPDSIHLLNLDQWNRVETIGTRMVDTLQQQGVAARSLPEGGYSPAVLPGILTLTGDLQRNMAQLKTRFQDIWTDSGSGVSAIGLLLGLRLAGITDCTVHVTLIAGDETEFRQRYQQLERWLEQLTGTPLPAGSPRLRLLKPASAASYGSVNRTILDQSWLIARETGLLMDPVYSVKHFYTVKRQMEAEPPQGPQLVLYNGSTLGLCGFQEALASRRGVV
ncbi:MAG: hypothetical protein OQL28_02965 [Sedimenticola sp.]|nr:hypothetical protein [Sedimenticola sp.]